MAAERFSSTRSPLGGEADCLTDDPTVDFSYQSVLLSDRQKASGRDNLAASSHHSQQQLLTWLATAEGNDRL